jgi:hypothetical protein
MKKILLAIAALVIAVSAQAQGTLTFHNKVGTEVNAKVTNDGVGVAGAEYTAQLVLVGGNGSLTALTPTAIFRTGAGIGYVSQPTEEVVVGGVAAGSSGTFRMRAWNTAAGSYAAASTIAGNWSGQSAPFTVSLGGGLLPGSNLVGLQAFSVTLTPVPEPATIALLALGGAALLIRRRK